LDKVKKIQTDTEKLKGNGRGSKETAHKPRCINIDCAFNSALDITRERNLCGHPNLRVASNLADITVAICSEFRYKKDYRFKAPNILIHEKTKERIEILPTAEPEFVSTESLRAEAAEEGVQEQPAARTEESKEIEIEEPKVVVAGDSMEIPRTTDEISEFYKLSDAKSSNFFQLKRLYRPNMKRGVIFSAVFHFFLIWLVFLLFVERDNHTEVPAEQRIVVVEDIETPKFEPPDLDKKEESPTPDDVGEVRPRITPKTVAPKIRRPKTVEEDTTGLSSKDTSRTSGLDTTLLSQSLGDTSRFMLPDSLRSSFAENEVGMSLWFPKDWKLRDSRDINKTENFTGVIINTDSASEDPGAVTMFILLENDQINSFNKTIFKNPFLMDDTLSTAFSTDPMLLGSKKMSYKFYVFAPTNKIYVNTEVKQELFDKYKKYVEAIVRSIKIVKKEMTAPPK
jgi:hypothetical protein